MFRRHTALLLALLFLVCTLSVANAETLEGNTSAQLTPAVWSAEPFEQPAWMQQDWLQQDNIARGCTYNQCMRHCTEEWITCHTVCNRDCDGGIQQVE